MAALSETCMHTVPVNHLIARFVVIRYGAKLTTTTTTTIKTRTKSCNCVAASICLTSLFAQAKLMPANRYNYFNSP